MFDNRYISIIYIVIFINLKKGALKMMDDEKYKTIVELLWNIKKNNMIPTQNELKKTMYYNQQTKKIIFGAVPNHYHH